MVPVDESRHAGNNGPFPGITSADQPEVVYVESAHQGQIITATTEVGRHRMWFAALQGVAWGPGQLLRPVQDGSTVTDWHKSSYGGGNNECGEAREYQDGAEVRDTQNRELDHLSFSRTEWSAFIETAQLSAR